MLIILLLLGAVINAAYFIMGVIKPGLRVSKAISRNPEIGMSFYEYFNQGGMILYGYFLLYQFKHDISLLDWNSIPHVGLIHLLTVVAYFISRHFKNKIGPVFLGILPGLIALGLLLNLALFVHFAWLALPMSLLLPSVPFIPAYFALFAGALLMWTELNTLLQRNQAKLKQLPEGDLKKVLLWMYGGKSALWVQVLTLPIYLFVVQLILNIFSQRPHDLIEAILRTSDGTFSELHSNPYAPPMNEYVCTVASFGSEWLVKPLHQGVRHKHPVRVTRQLQVCNAFEEMLCEKLPRLHKPLRRFYDSLQIPVEKWKRVRLISNFLFFLIKPIEWFGWICLYCFHPDPETKIQKQYLNLDLGIRIQES